MTDVVDATSYLKLGHLFVANVTGNIVSLGLTPPHASSPSPTTTVLTLTLTGLASDSTLVGGSGSKLGRRDLAVAAMARRGGRGLLALEVDNAAALGLAVAALVAIDLAATKLTTTRAA